MSTLQVLPTRTFSVKVSVCSLIGPDSTSNETICSRAGGVRSAIGAVFKLLLLGQPLGPAAAVPDAPSVAARAPATRLTSETAATTAITSGREAKPCRDIGCQGNRSIAPSSVDQARAPPHPEEASPQRDREGRRRTWTLSTCLKI